MSIFFNDAANSSPERREAFSASSKFELSRLPLEVINLMTARTKVVNKAVYRLEKNPTSRYEVSIKSDTPKPIEYKAVLSGTDSRLDKAGGSIVITTDDPLANPQFSAELDDKQRAVWVARQLVKQHAIPGSIEQSHLPPDVIDAIQLTDPGDLSRGA